MRPSTQRKLAAWLAEHKNRHLCACGCGEYITPEAKYYFKGYVARYVMGHQTRGENHPGKTGTVIMKGYVWHRQPEHRLANPRGYVKRCWLVAERKIGRPLREDDVVHHIDGNKLNDRPSNIAVIGYYNHRTHHAAGEMNPRYRRDVDTVLDILPLVRQGLTFKAIAQRLHCSQRMVMMRLHHEGIWVRPYLKGISGRKPFRKAA